MSELDYSQLPLRALKIIRKGYKNNRRDPQNRLRLKHITDLIEKKERFYTKSKKVIK